MAAPLDPPSNPKLLSRKNKMNESCTTVMSKPYPSNISVDDYITINNKLRAEIKELISLIEHQMQKVQEERMLDRQF